MPTNRRILVLALILVVAIVAAWWYWFRDPAKQLRTMTGWLDSTTTEDGFIEAPSLRNQAPIFVISAQFLVICASRLACDFGLSRPRPLCYGPAR